MKIEESIQFLKNVLVLVGCLLILAILCLPTASAWNFPSTSSSGTGSVGPQGPQGPQGIQGVKGDTGNTGPAGEVTLAVLNNGSYFNVIGGDTFVANYSTFLVHTANNVSVTNALATKLGISQWNATNTSYVLWANVMNGSVMHPNDWNATNTSYYLDTNPKGFYNSTSNIGNWSFDKSTYTLLSVLNNGSYLNVAGGDTFIANYSTFLTHTSWATVMNGTLFKTSQWNATNTSYLTVETLWNLNYSTFLVHTANNVSLTNYINSNNVSVNNYIATLTGGGVSWVTVMNGTLFKTSQWNATNTSYIVHTGDTMTGNLSMGNNCITNGTVGGSSICFNGTGIVLTG